MARSHRQVRRRLIALFNVMFVVGALALLGGVSLLVFALGWYSMGEDMRNPKLWSNVYPCQVTSYRTELGGSTYKATTKVIFQVAFANQTNLCALAHLDPWVSPEEAQNEIDRFGTSKNITTCFCPTSDVNLYFPSDKWSIYKFCYLQLTEKEISGLIYYYDLMFYGGIALLVIAPFAITIPLIVWLRSRCFKLPLNAVCCGSSGYSLLN